MLKLRKVEIFGFKSFCERTHVHFSGSGLTCIVGPNGCGKSNIVDAISWVLGEQSHKSLRAERMADCIFAGTAKRPPLGLAEVVITLEDSELAEAGRFILTPDSSEVASGIQAQNGADSSTAELDTTGGGESPAAEMPDPFGPSNGSALGRPKADGSAEPGPAAPAPGKKRAAKPAMRLKPGQVVIGRRLYRSGQSEYLINGRAARLRDVQELFMGLGLGPDSYAIIEQGRIGMILSSKPADRRAIIEEAAGVTKYKTKKRLAEAKLEASKLNLNRVNDIVVEVEKQLASLKRQASRARRYTELREQMRGVLRQVLASKALEFDREAERLSAALEQICGQEAAESQELGVLETDQERLSTRSYELDAELRQNQNLLGQAMLELDRAENRIAFNRERGRELAARAQQLAGQRDQADAQLAQIEKRAAEQWRALVALRAEAEHVDELVSQASLRGVETAAQAEALESSIAELDRSASAWGAELQQLHADHAQAAEALTHHGQALANEEAREHALREESLPARERLRTAEARQQQVTELARRMAEQSQAAQSAVADLRARERQGQGRCATARDTLTGARARRATLEQVLNDRAYTAEAVKKLFLAHAQPGGRDFRAVGLLADYAEVQEKYEAAIEQFLRDELEYVVVETFDHARTGISLLREELGGRATFFVDSLQMLPFESEDPVIPFPTAEGVVSRLDRLLEFRQPLGAAAKRFLPRLQSAYLVETSAAAERLAHRYPAYSFVTPDGTHYQGRVVSGGRKAEAGPLSLKRELRALESEQEQRERELALAQAELERIATERSATEDALARLAAEHLEAEKQLIGVTHQRDQARADYERSHTALRACQAAVEQLRREVAGARARAEFADRQRQATSASRAGAEQQIAAAGVRLAGLRQEAEQQRQQLAIHREEAAKLAERLAASELLASRSEQECAEAAIRAAGLHSQQEQLAAEREQLEAESSEQARRMDSLRGEKEGFEARKAALEQEWEQARTRTVRTDDLLRLARQKLSDLREERGRVEVERARNDSERGHLRETCLAELNAHPEDLMAEFPALLTGEELAAADAHYREMRERIDTMGPVNMMALEEYNECEQRYGFLTRERDDLLASIADTQQAIAELDEVSRQKFEAAFTGINAAFGEAFRTLFGGGAGEMRLTEPDSSGDPGIDVVAQPPGKRLQNVVLLSGGEKALTALALLIAIFRYQPSPFCILDEVDAPLDEANVGRFADMVAQMGHQAQFIVVTHNRRTMELAPVLYGVTMQEPGVSKLVSVRWDEGQPEHAATSAA